MNKTKVIHIHTDKKFIDSSKRFEGDGFDNTIIYIGKKNDYKGYYKDSTFFHQFSLNSISSIIKICKTANIVVLYDLNFPKAYIANRLPDSVKVVWRFFGHELYSKIPDYVLSEKTIQSAIKKDKRYNFVSFKNNLTLLYSKVRFKSSYKHEFHNAAFKRIDYFHGLSDKEYEFLKGIWPQLPPFLQISYNQHTTINNYSEKKSNLIIIGNNRSAYNNHLDIIDLIQQSNEKSKYQFVLLFNYGQNNAYANAVRAKATEVKSIKVLDVFLAFDEFEKLYTEVDALVLNGYRQMAMGNIFTAFRNNTKLYLNEKNIIFDWLKEEGFIIFSIKDFISDLNAHTTKLTGSEAISNQNQLIIFTAKYSKKLFHDSIYKILNNNLTS